MARLSVGAKVAILGGAFAIVSVAVLAIALITLRQSVGLYWIPSSAMSPTLLPGDRIAVNKKAYLRAEPQRGDIVVFKSPPEARQNEKVFVKRIVAIPGDTVRITAGYVLIGNQEFHHRELRDILEQRANIEIKDGRVYEDGKVIPNEEIATLAAPQVGPQPVGIKTDKTTGESKVLIGPQDSPAMALDAHDLSSLLETRHSIKLVGDEIYRDGKRIDKARLAAGVGSSKANVQVMPGFVYVNGKALDEPYVAEDPDDAYPGGPRNSIKPEWLASEKTGKETVKVVRIPKGKLLVMGDNRNDSNDSRYWGLLDRSRVTGKVTSILSPENRAGAVK